jgi:hypothetical protein
VKRIADALDVATRRVVCGDMSHEIQDSGEIRVATAAVGPTPTRNKEMKINKAWEHQTRHSTKLSDVVRQLCFVGVILVWVYRVGDGPTARVPSSLVPVTILLASSLLVDVFQYVYLSLVWNIFSRAKEKKLYSQGLDAAEVEAVEFSAWRHINKPGNVLFWCKVVLAVVGYALLLEFLAQKVA